MTAHDRLHVKDALDHLQRIQNHLQTADLSSLVVSDAVSFRLAAAIESLSKTSAEFRNTQFGDDWALMWAVRNRITHAYSLVDLDVIAETVRVHVPLLQRELTIYLINSQ